MAVNKVEFGNQTIMDITDTTADADEVIEGEVFYTRGGIRTVGTLGDATQSTHGLMSASDKSKLDGIDTGANNYTLPVMSSTTLGGAYIDDTLSSITIWHNPLNNKDILILNAANSADIKSGSALNKPASVYRQHESVFYGLSKAAGQDLASVENITIGTYPDASKTAIQNMLGVPSTATATTSAAGLMSAADKTKLDGITSGAAVTDVQINSTSILNNGIANIPISSSSNLGVVKINSNYGITINESNELSIVQPVDAQIKLGMGSYTFITAAKQNMSVFYGLAKAAGDTTQALSLNDVGTYTDTAKAAIQTMLGVSPIIEVIRL